jgi:hypothetical protein
MRRQERGMTEHNEYNVAQLYMGGRRQGGDLFPKKRRPSVSTIHAVRTRPRGDGKFGSSEDFEVYDVLEKEPRSNGPTSYQTDRHGYLLKVKIEIPEQMPDRANNSSARSIVTENLGPNQQVDRRRSGLSYILKVKIKRRSAFVMGPICAKLKKYKVTAN